MAMGLISLGLKKGECVSVIGENRPEWVYSDFGIMSAGGFAARVYRTNAAEQCGYIVQFSVIQVRGDDGKVSVFWMGHRTHFDSKVPFFGDKVRIGYVKDKLAGSAVTRITILPRGIR